MTISEIPGVARLSTPERILLVEDLWDSIVLEEENVPVPKSHLDELEIRLKKYRSNPGNLLSIEELQARIKNRK